MSKMRNPSGRKAVTKVLWIAVAFWSLAAGCRTSDPSGSETLDETLAPPAGFVGCRPSVGECKNSCPERDGDARSDESLCQKDGDEPWACFCGGAQPEEPREDPDPSTHTFIGCRPNAGECVNSCPNRQGYGVENTMRCPREAPDGVFACFCKVAP
jgi:hypothetical protein